MQTWHWVRHGPTHERNFVGWRDVPADLSDLRMLERLSRLLPQKAVLVSSDLQRSSATADAIATPARIRLPDRKDLRELHFGEWDGLHHSEVSRRDPELSRAYWETPGDVVAPGGESWNEAATRVNRAVDAICEEQSARHVIAVAHFGVILTQVQRALGVRPEEVFKHKIDNLSVTALHHDGQRWSVGAINTLP
ncbi:MULTISPECIES: histidine phosphatase family protein [unclassified Sulfitobacter]|uniref:histidine phosphatase family protein n=1 Tax=unclassified Sulfitobacter TaxID=196795 RepID=UPI0007C2A587|nr:MULTISPECIES: histidine phosphatase family protein [unclassified Sulfitobacter]KZY05582.1 phosphoglycerate mutase [Sulfitobacter sp. HI0023]KZY25777.1 phosphoglycerate mutase [Sulfitobacter sp. HI0040]KZZ66555.1 phosphoglycerate mutase [Sulfitobacter sp. HI0129]